MLRKSWMSVFHCSFLVLGLAAIACDGEENETDTGELDTSEPSNSPYYLSVTIDGNHRIWEFEDLESTGGILHMGFEDENNFEAGYEIDEGSGVLFGGEFGVFDGDPGLYYIDCQNLNNYECVEGQIQDGTDSTIHGHFVIVEEDAIRGKIAGRLLAEDWDSNDDYYVEALYAFSFPKEN